MHHRVTHEPMIDPIEVIRPSIGGYPILPAGESWPVCAEENCGRRLALFFQFDVEDRFCLPFASGSTLSVFQCLAHVDPFDEVDKRIYETDDILPDNYWNHSNYAIFFIAPSEQRQSTACEPFVKYSKLIFTSEREPGPRSVEALNFKDIKIGGFPYWVQTPKRRICSCGAKMEFVCSAPGDFQFPRAIGSPSQPNGRADSYFLFLGLSTYIFACRARCDPRAVLAIRQN